MNSSLIVICSRSLTISDEKQLLKLHEQKEGKKYVFMVDESWSRTSKQITKLPLTDLATCLRIVEKTVVSIGGVFVASKLASDYRAGNLLAEQLQVRFLNFPAPKKLPADHSIISSKSYLATMVATPNQSRILLISRVQMCDSLHSVDCVDLILGEHHLKSYASESLREKTLLSLTNSFRGVVNVHFDVQEDGRVTIHHLEDWEGVGFWRATQDFKDICLFKIRLLVASGTYFDDLQSEPEPISSSQVKQECRLVRYVYPKKTESEKFLRRSDYVAKRLYSADIIEWILCNESLVDAVETISESKKNRILHGSAGIIYSKMSCYDGADLIEKLNSAFVEREFNLPMVTINPLKEKNTLVIVEGGWNSNWRIHHFQTWLAMGYKVIVIDRPGHWLEGNNKLDDYLNPYKFIAMDMTADDHLIERLLDTVQNLGEDVHGISTMNDSYLAAVSSVSEILELPTTATPLLFKKCIDKANFRAAYPILGHPSILVQTTDDIQSTINCKELKYPIIIKPQHGAGSLGVFRIDSDNELMEIWKSNISKLIVNGCNEGALIEPYIEGPEVDINIILQNGKVLFCEISDEGPFEGDRFDNVESKSFSAAPQIFPSNLPEEEQHILRTTCTDTILNMGMRDGIFHIECRLSRQTEGTIAVIIEVNPRIPGFFIPETIEKVHGVDYAAVQYELALGRDISQLVQPFKSQSMWVYFLPIHIPAGGILKSKNIFKSIEKFNSHIICTRQFFHLGDAIPEPSKGNLFKLGMFEVFSKKSYEDVKTIGDQIFENLKFVIEKPFQIQSKKSSVENAWLVILPQDGRISEISYLLKTLQAAQFEETRIILVSTNSQLFASKTALPDSQFTTLVGRDCYSVVRDYVSLEQPNIIGLVVASGQIEDIRAGTKICKEFDLSVLPFESTRTGASPPVDGKNSISVVVVDDDLNIHTVMGAKKSRNKECHQYNFNYDDIFLNTEDKITGFQPELQPGVYTIEYSIQETNLYQIHDITSWEGVGLLRAIQEIAGINLMIVRYLLCQRNNAKLSEYISKATKCCTDSYTLRTVYYNSANQFLERADYLSWRLQDVPEISWFMAPSTQLELQASRLSDISVGCFLFTAVQESNLDSLFQKRHFYLPVTVSNPLKKNTLIFIAGGFSFEWRRNYYEVAAAMGIRLIVLDRPGHWLENQDLHDVPHYLRVARFVPIDLTVDNGLTSRIVSAVKQLGEEVHGLCAINDELLAPTSEACEMLGLPHSSAKSFLLCVDKSEMRKRLPIRGCPGTLIRSRNEIEIAAEENNITYPAIMKVQKGGGSNGVVKVYDNSELLCYWDSLFKDLVRENSIGVLIEPYFGGIEVDVNFVLQNGELLFWEVNDQDPCEGDKSDVNNTRTFLESVATYPTTLLSKKQQIHTMEFCFRALMRFGFTTGVYHVEARFDPILEECMIIEINPRAPGFRIPITVSRVHGIDYAMISMLQALGRDLRASTCPFEKPPLWIRIIVPPAPSGGGTMPYDDIFCNVRSHKNVNASENFFKKGQVVPDPEKGNTMWLGRLEVISRISSDDLNDATSDILPKILTDLA